LGATVTLQWWLRRETRQLQSVAVEEARRDTVAQYALTDDDYRLLVRPSGTEPVMRVMIEALDGEFVHAFVTRVAAAHAVAI